MPPKEALTHGAYLLSGACYSFRRYAQGIRPSIFVKFHQTLTSGVGGVAFTIILNRHTEKRTAATPNANHHFKTGE